MTDKNKFLVGVEVDDSGNAIMTFNDGSSAEVNIKALNDEFTKYQTKYKVKELWIDVPGHGMNELNPNDLVKFHVASEYPNDKVQLIDEYVKVDDLIKFLNNYGKK